MNLAKEILDQLGTFVNNVVCKNIFSLDGYLSTSRFLIQQIFTSSSRFSWLVHYDMTFFQACIDRKDVKWIAFFVETKKTFTSFGLPVVKQTVKLTNCRVDLFLPFMINFAYAWFYLNMVKKSFIRLYNHSRN